MSGFDAAARDDLRSLIERVERLNEEKHALADDIKEVFAEAKARGYDPATMRKVIKARAVDAAERDEQSALYDLYMHAVDARLAEPVASDALERAMRKAAEKPKKAVRRRAVRDDDNNVVGFPHGGGTKQ